MSSKLLELRHNTVFEELEVSLNCRFDGRKYVFYWRREVKRIFATVKSTIDTDNSSNTVLLFLFL